MVNSGGKNYGCVGGKLVYLDSRTYTDDTIKVLRRRAVQVINGDIFQSRGKRLQMNRFEMICELGVGQITINELPRVRIETSTDGGLSWKHETWLKLGRLGLTDLKAEWWSNKTFYDLVIRFSFDEPVPLYVRSACIDLRLAGR